MRVYYARIILLQMEKASHRDDFLNFSSYRKAKIKKITKIMYIQKKLQGNSS